MRSCLYAGWVRHRRHAPTSHAFTYSGCWLYLDLAELGQVFRGRWFWSVERKTPVSFRRADHLGDPAAPLDVAVRDLVERESGVRPSGPIRLLTQPRCFGYVFNPVSFYYCFSPDEELQSIVAEVHNTPWGERHCYVLHGGNRTSDERHRYRHAKEFHVSPFLEMDLDYRWSVTVPAERLLVHLEDVRENERILDVTFALSRRPIDGGSLARAWLRHPGMSAGITAGIYWQAARLWWKRCPFYAHPPQKTPAGEPCLPR